MDPVMSGEIQTVWCHACHRIIFGYARTKPGSRGLLWMDSIARYHDEFCTSNGPVEAKYPDDPERSIA